MDKQKWGLLAAGFAAGAVNGFFGAGGGMVLIPLMGLFLPREDRTMFSSSVAVILPICLVSLFFSSQQDAIPWSTALPWLPGSAAGGFLAAKYGDKIPVPWLHRVLGAMILYGGIRYLC